LRSSFGNSAPAGSSLQDYRAALAGAQHFTIPSTLRIFQEHSISLSLNWLRKVMERYLSRKHVKIQSSLLWLTLAAVALMGSCVRPIDDQLVAAAYDGDAAKVEALLKRGANVEIRARDGWTPLTIAAREGRTDIVLALLRAGAKPNAEEGGGNTALFWATYYGHVDTARSLIANGADLNHRCGHCKSALQAAIERNYPELAETLRKAGAVN
jgi:hypothetical protein